MNMNIAYHEVHHIGHVRMKRLIFSLEGLERVGTRSADLSGGFGQVEVRPWGIVILCTGANNIGIYRKKLLRSVAEACTYQKRTVYRCRDGDRTRCSRINVTESE